MTEQEYLDLKRGIEAERVKKLEALELVWAMCRDRSHDHGQEEQPPPTRAARPRRGTVEQAVGRALLRIDDGAEFTIHDVRRIMHDIDSDTDAMHRASISSVLRRFADSGKLEVVVLGAGKKPSTYRKAREQQEAFRDDYEDHM